MSEPRFCSSDKDGWVVVPQPTSSSSSSSSDGREQQTVSIVGPLPQQPVLCQQRVDPAGVTAGELARSSSSSSSSSESSKMPQQQPCMAFSKGYSSQGTSREWLLGFIGMSWLLALFISTL
jgi:hypothetical protein